jgi:glycosyltransferase involved in cell wall biosynthesis
MTTRMMRVLMVTGAYHPEISSGGVQCRNVARALAGRAEVEVLTTSVDPSLPRHDQVDGVPVTRIRIDVRSGLSKVRAFRRMVLDLVRLVAATDVVHLHGYSTKNVIVTIIAKAFRKRIVMSLHTSGFDEPEAIERQGSLAWWAFLSADLYLSVSSGLVESYLSAGLPPEKILEVPNGIDIERFSPAGFAERQQLRTRLALPAGAPVIVFVGFFSADKQPRVLFDAWRSLAAGSGPPPTLLFVGATASPYFEVNDTIAVEMRAEAERLGLADRLHFTGLTHEVESYLRASDLFVLPSRREGLPVALLEAMACGLPCIASRLRGSTETIIEDEVNGLMTPPGDAAALARAIARVLPDPELQRRLGAAARATITNRYSSATIADRWLEAYDLIPTLAR